MAQPAFDPYRDWLGITDAQRPLNYYQLLRLEPFEDETAKIRGNYHQLNMHVRRQLAGKAAEVAHRLLVELTKAMLCLTDTRRKAEYDVSIGRSTEIDTRNLAFDEILIKRKVLDSVALEKAKKFSAATGIELHDSIVQQKLAPQEAVTQARADALGVSFLDLSEFEPNMELIVHMPAVMARQHSCVPLVIENNTLLVASPNPLQDQIEDEIRLRFALPIRAVLCTPAQIHDFIGKHYPRELAAKQMGATAARSATAGETSKSSASDRLSPQERAKRKQQFMLVGGAFPFMLVALIGSTVLGISAWYVYPIGAVVGVLGAYVGSKMA